MAIAEKALSELTDISSQVRAAVLFDGGGKVLASTLPAERAEGFAVAAKLLWEQAEVVRTGDEAKLTQLEAATADGSVFIVREAEQTARGRHVAGADGRARVLRPEVGASLRRREAEAEEAQGSSQEIDAESKAQWVVVALSPSAP